jgi:hypothetical protein
VAVHVFDLTPDDPEVLLDGDRWTRVQFHLAELLPARWVRLVGDPPTRIRVLAYGERGDMPSGLLALVEDRAGTGMRVEHRKRWGSLSGRHR